MFSADGLGGIDAGLVDDEKVALEKIQLPTQSETLPTAAQDIERLRRELVLVSEGVDEDAQLLAYFSTRASDTTLVDFVVIDAERDGLVQISEALAAGENLDAVHIVASGREGAIELGSSTLDHTSILARSDEVAAWKTALGEQAQLLLHGSELGTTKEGCALVCALAELTNADVAASDDLTGRAIIEGAWDVAYAGGTLETTIASLELNLTTWAEGLARDRALDADVTLSSATRVETAERPISGSSAAATTHEATRRELVLVDIDTPNYTAILSELSASRQANGLEIIALDNNRDGIDQITELLARYDDLDSVHIISHGEAGGIDLGASRLDSEVITARASTVASWGSAFNESGDILIYGCDLAASQDGRYLIDQLAILTTADIAASDDLTGHATLGGDWDLEYQVGALETTLVTFGDEWLQVLAVNTAPVNSVPGAQVTAQDTSVTFSSTGGNAITTSDADAGTSPIELTASVTDGTLTVVPVLAVGGEQRVNTNTALDDTTANVAVAADGSFVVVRAKLDGAQGEIYFQRFDASGTPVGADTLANITTLDQQAAPDIAMAADGSFVLTWQSSGQDGDGSGVIARRFAADGTALSGEIIVNSYTTSNQMFPNVAADDAGNFIVVWQSFGQDANSWGVYGQRFDSAGGAQGAEIQIHTTTVDLQRNPSVAMDSDGDFVVAWESQSQDGSSFGVYSQRYDASGTPQGPETLVNTTTSNSQTSASVAMDAAGNYAVVWYDNNGTDIKLQRYATDGTALGGETLVNTEQADTQSTPSIAMSATGEFVVSWASNLQDGDARGVFAQRFDAAGATVGGEFKVNTTTSGTQWRPATGINAAGRLVVTWSGEGPGDAAGTFVQAYDNSNLNFTAGDGVNDASFTVEGTVDALNALLDGLTFTPTTSFQGTATLTITTNDLGNTGTPGPLQDVDHVAIVVGTSVLAPSVDLDPDDSTSAGLDFAASWAEGAGPVVIVDTDAMLTDADSTILTSLSVTLTNPLDGTSEVLAADTSGTSISADYNSAAGVLTLSGADSVANYQKVLRTVTYDNTSEVTDATARVVTFQASDGVQSSVVATTTLAIIAQNDAPTNTVPGTQSTSTDTELVFSTATTNAIVVADADAASAATLEVTLSVSDGTLSLAQVGALGAQSAANTTAADVQEDIAIAVTPTGEFIAVWESRQTGSREVYAQLYDAAGNTVGGEFRVNETVSGSQYDPSVAIDHGGNFVVVWRDTRTGDDTYARLFDAAGNPTTGDFRVNTTLANDSEPDVAMDAAGNFTIVWQSVDTSGEGIRGQRYDASGVPQGGEFVVNTTTAGEQDDPALAMAGDGRFVVIWESTDQDGSGEGTYAQLYDAAGATVGGEFLVNTTTSGSQDEPDVAMADDGSFVVAWQMNDADENGIYIQRFDATGTKVGGEVQVNTQTAFEQSVPNVSMNGAGEFTVTWTSALQDGNEEGVYARRFDASGVALGGEIALASDTAGSQNRSAIAMHDAGFIAGWSGAAGGDDSAVSIRRFEKVDVTFVTGDGVDDTIVTIQGTQAELNAVLDGLVYRPEDGYIGYATLTVTTDDLGNTGSPGALQVADPIIIAVGTPGILVTATSPVQSVGVETQVNTTTASDQGAPASASDADGNTVVVWHSLNQDDGASYGIYAQRYDASGSPVGGEILVNTTTADQQLTPDVSMAADGRFVVVWSSTNQDGDGTGIYGQRYDASGSALGVEFQIHTTTAGAQDAPSVALADDGSFVVVWHSFGLDGSDYAIAGQRFAANGDPVGSEFGVNSYAIGAQTNAQVAIDADGDFVVAWTSQGQDGSGAGVYAQRFDRAGVERGSEIQIHASTANDQEISGVAMDASGGFVVVWTSDLQDGDATGIYARRFGADGTPLSSEFLVNSTTTGAQSTADIAMNDAGDFVISWTSAGQDGSGGGVFAQRFFANSSLSGTEFQINTTSLGDQTASTIAMDAAGGFSVAWTSLSQDGDLGGIYAQRFTQATTEAGGTAVFEVALTGPPTDDVTIALVLPDGTEASLSTGSLTFTSSDWNVAQVVIVTGLPDALPDGEVAYVIQTDASTSTDSRYAVLDPANLRLTNHEAPLVNTTPVAAGDNYNTTEDTPLVFDPTTNDTDADADAITVTEFTQPTNGTVVDNGDGTLTYTPDPGYIGPDSFEYVAIDAGANLMNYWNFDGDASDALGGADGTLVGTTTVPGEQGNALSFDDTSGDHVLIPDVTYGSEFSISIDFKLDDNTGTLFQYLYSHGDVNSTNSINVFINEATHGTDPNVLRTVIRDGDDPLDNLALQFDISGIVGDSQWHTYTATVGANGIEVFLDGVSMASDATRGVDGVDPAGSLYVGGKQSLDADRFFSGEVDSLQIYGTALDVTQISDIVAGGNIATVTITVDPVNDAPTYGATLNGNPTFIEGGAAVVLDADVNVSDSELDALNSGLGNYSGASLTIVRNGGASAEDLLSFNDGNGITLVGNDLIKSSQIIASFDTTTTAGELVITFSDANGEIPTSVDVDNILRQITYANSSDTPPASVQLDWTFSDGNTGTQGSGGALAVVGGTTVNNTAVNDVPIDISLTPQVHNIADNPVQVIGGLTGSQNTTATLVDGRTVTISLSGGDVVAQIFDANGNPLTSQFIAIDDADNDIGSLSAPAVAAMPDGSFIVVAQADGYIGSVNWGRAIIGAVFDADGNRQTVTPQNNSIGGYIVVSNTSAGNTHQRTPTVDVAGDGTITVQWNNTSSGQFEQRSFQIIGPAVSEDTADGTVVTTFSTVDPDNASGFTYSILGGDSNFEIVGDELRVKAGNSIDYENANSHTLTIRTTDAGGLTHDEQVTVVVTNINEAPSFELPGEAVFTSSEWGYNQNKGSLVFADGSMLITPYDSSIDSELVKLNADGSIDTSFGTNGYADVTGIGYIQSVTEQPDGKILVSGRESGGIFIARYEADGTLDGGFGTSGVTTLTAGSYEEATAVAVQSDGSIVLVGEHGDDSVIIRFTSSGIVDGGFGTSGNVFVNLGGTFENLESVTILGDGSIVAVGETSVVKMDSDGNLDAGFGTSGILDLGDDVYGVAVQSDGKFAVTGGDGTNLFVTRFNADGTTDTDFGTSGTATWSTSAATGYSIVQQSDGKLVVAGHTDAYPTQWVAVRFDVDGSLDTAFGTGGAWVMDSSTDFSEAYSVSLYNDGTSEKIVIGGNTTRDGFGDSTYSTMIRLNSNGGLDATLGTNTLDGNPAFVEGSGTPVVLDADVSIHDSELSELNSGDGNYDGASLTLVRNGGANSDDVLSFNAGNGITLSGVNLIKNGQVIATFDTTSTTGELIITFTDANTEIPTSADVDNILRQITYANSNGTPPASVQLDWTFDDGNTGSQGTGGALQALGSTTVSITASNNAPVINSTPNLLTNGDLSTGDLTGWNTTGTVDVVGEQMRFGTGDTVAPHTASQTFTTEIGKTYIVTLQHGDDSASDRQILQVDVDGATNLLSQTSYTSVSGVGMSTRTYSFTADSASTTLTLTDVSIVTVGVDGLVDNISVGEKLMLDTITEDDVDGAGQTVASLLGSTPIDLVTDADSGAVEGIAIVGINDSFDNSTFDYSTDGGATWTKSYQPSTSEAVLLRATDLIRFDPSGYEAESATFTFRAWDQTSGSAGDIVDVSVNGGSTAYSSETAVATVITTDINDAPQFGSAQTGVSSYTHASNTNNTTNQEDVLILSDGSVLVSEYIQVDGSWEVSVVKFNADGSVDTNFADNGRLIAPTLDANFGADLAQQADGKILLATSNYNGTDYDALVVRYNLDGSLDTGFATGGVFTYDGGGSESFYAIAVQADGSIVAGGDDNADSIVVRLNSDGTLDSGFASGGIGTFAFDVGQQDSVKNIVIQADGKIVLGGDHIPFNLEAYVARLNSDGTLDGSFATGGFATSDFGNVNGSDAVTDMTLQADGKILITGRTGDGQWGISRFNTDGSLDTSFDGDGHLQETFVHDGWTHIAGVVQQSDGQLVIGGAADFGKDQDDWVLIRYNLDGSRDTSYGEDGVNVLALGLHWNEAFAIDIAADDTVVLTGYSSDTYSTTVAYVGTDGNLDGTQQSGLLGGNVSYIEDGPAVVLDADVIIFDRDLHSGNYDGSTLTLVRNGGASADDVFSATGSLGALTEGADLTLSGTIVGTVTTNSGGVLVLTFGNSSDQEETNEVLRQIAYSNSSDNPDPSVQIDWTFDDGGDSVQTQGGSALEATGSTAVNITAVNDAPTFDVSGWTTTDTGDGNDADGENVLVQPDGKVVVAGYTLHGGQYVFGVTRYTADGALDPSFGGDGTVTVAVGDGNVFGVGVALQADGKIVLTSDVRVGGVWQIGVVRLDANGVLDTTFGGGDGIVETPIGASAGSNAVIVQPDGKLLVAGTSTSGFALVRYNADGSLDTSFSGDGVADPSFSGYANAVALQSDGKIVVTGNGFEVARYNADGTLDTGFGGGDCILTVASGAGNIVSNEVLVQPDGRIVLVGITSQHTSAQVISLARLNTDGSMDTSFGVGGTVLTDASNGRDYAFGATQQADGKIVVTGYATEDSQQKIAVLRYNVDGTLDSGFGGGDGLFTLDTGSGSNWGSDVAVLPDGRIVVSGLASPDGAWQFAVVGYNADGSLDTSFAPVNTLDGSPTFVEGGAAVVLDGDVEIFDAELSDVNNFDGATLTLARNLGAYAEDVYSATGTLGALSEGSNLVVGATTIGTVTTNSAGTLVLTFNSNATNVLVNSAMQQIAYSNSSVNIDETVQIDWTFDDGGSGQGTGGAQQVVGSSTVDLVATPLTVQSIVTVDSDGDGFLDAVQITFSEAIDDSTVVANDWDVAGVAGESFNATAYGDTANDSVIYIGFNGGVLNNGALPDVSYAGDNPTDADVANLYGLEMANLNTVVEIGGFETPDQGASGYTANPGGTPWTFTHIRSGLAGPNSTWSNGDPSPDPLGDQFAFLHLEATISRTLTGLTVGVSYEVNFFESYRVGYASGNDLHVIIDDGLPSETTIYLNSNVNNPTWESRTSQFVATSTSHTLTFRTTNPLVDDAATIIDAVTISDPTRQADVTTTDGANDVPVFNGLDGNPTFIEDGSAVVLDSDVSVSDAELDALNSGNGNYDGASLTIVRNAGVNADDVLGLNAGNGITLSGGNLIKNSQIIATFDTTSTTGELVITFTDANTEIPTSADVDNILRQITYANTSDAPPSSVQVDWAFDDGNSGSQGTGGALQALGSTTVNITLVNDAPTITIDPIDVEFTEQSPVGIDINIVIGDADDVNLEGASVRISAGYENGVDSLNWTPQAGITGTFDAPTGTLTFTGTATVADYQTLLRTVSFVNNSDTPDTTTRTVEVIVDDGTDTSTAVTRNINITAANDTVSGQPAITGTTTEHETLTADTSAIADEDGLGSFTYQWYRDGSPISRATGSTYVLNDLDVGTNMTVTVSYTDGEGNWESTTSNATGPVVGVNDAPTFGSEPGFAIGHGSESYSQNEASLALAEGS
ncbi:MAG: DUF4347 domain-containing protein, partial [Gammaproteobacteria bacterium]|nr:DUF4347 domain-containing protein [Gammaproteobacteria bacterium]